MSEFLVPAGEARAELEMRRSRFIAHAVPAFSVAEARDVIEERRREWSDATHVVYAYVVGSPRSEVQGMSDDGEPHGTAARPVMALIRGRRLWNVVVTVVRYFGGVKLGTGGLVHAYAEAARRALDRLPVRPFVPMARIRLVVPYPLFSRLGPLLEEYEVTVLEQEFTSEISLTCRLPRRCLEGFSKGLRDLGSGSDVDILEEEGA
ncbi:protein of unknown function UPF0029 [Spirochaeta thermophila DSM 6578]|uniref:Impact N-terminal domain-containing protein n=1 Tax=Winmispira thermophila (strain ATCC 700085 / DSM 6578 / Z-1203) TaxID=869211 RepID=G0GD74_WINT7|nr:YigZ family protein [Spirochaeta thermophila]AEJ62149.1 protein of unknown function UPF0029 [Spirochaeta thermophila DSM 6578]